MQNITPVRARAQVSALAPPSSAARPAEPLPASLLTGKARTSVLDACARLRGIPGPLLPILHAVQNALGYVPPAAVPLIAEHLNLSRADVHGVISFYHYFRSEPTGRHVLELCRAEACQARGAVALEAHVRQTLGIDYHQTSADGEITLEAVYCLGNCANGPSLLLDRELHGRVSAQGFDALMEACKHPETSL